jgi:hypothetical protein
LGWPGEDAIADVDDADDAPADPEVVETEIAEEPATYVSGNVSERVLATVNSASRGWTVTVRSEDDYLAVLELLEGDNPKSLMLNHDPRMGHHSMATG